MFGANVKARREALGMTREMLAEAVGTTAETIRMYEGGFSAPGLGKAFKIAEALQTTVDALGRETA